MHKNSMTLHGKDGQRKYLNQRERLRFLEATKNQPLAVRLFCQLLYYSGARIAEVHNLTAQMIDHSNFAIVIESLKKRQKGIFREIPVPEFLLDDLITYVELMKLNPKTCLWSFSLRTASRKIKKVMRLACIDGVKSSAKGLRHGFAVYAVSKAPLTLVKKWLGHARLETTEIYLNIIGIEERDFARRTWS